MALLTTVLILLACCEFVSSKRYCQEDSDCDVIGDLTCQKSICDNWGICGCPRGQASRFVGSSLKFQCITLKKIGESCSTDSTGGLCGAPNSKCEDGKCVCDTGFVSVWDGENCMSTTTKSSVPSETCSTSLGTCNVLNGCKSEFWWGANARSPINGVPSSCACADNQQTVIPNQYDSSPFVGRRWPICVDIALGDKCMRNSDCSNIANAECDKTTFVCKCTTGDPGPNGDECGSYLKRDETCYIGSTGTTTGTCGHGMVCGDVCDISEYIDNTKNKNCICAPGYTTSGAGCAAVVVGSNCIGDASCIGLGYDALCLDGVCQSGASTTVLSFTILLLALATHLLTLVSN